MDLGDALEIPNARDVSQEIRSPVAAARDNEQMFLGIG